MKNKLNLKALTFDTGGTILDWHKGFKKAFEEVKKNNLYNYKCSELANEFRRISLEKITKQDGRELINFDQAHWYAIDELSKSRNIAFTDKEKQHISMHAPSNLKVWDDFKEPYEVLRQKYFCISFTLLSNRLVYLNSKKNQINWDLILSCESLEIYKPNIEAYLKVAKLLQIPPENCGMVACHSFDLNAAKSAGFKTIFVKRTKEWGEDTKIHIDGDYDLVVDSFTELTRIL
tara:strand:+ start:574 stop:1272 length:699 start_codon:yes stop_codon:yes gene_type:complete